MNVNIKGFYAVLSMCWHIYRPYNNLPNSFIIWYINLTLLRDVLKTVKDVLKLFFVIFTWIFERKFRRQEEGSYCPDSTNTSRGRPATDIPTS